MVSGRFTVLADPEARKGETETIEVLIIELITAIVEAVVGPLRLPEKSTIAPFVTKRVTQKSIAMT